MLFITKNGNAQYTPDYRTPDSTFLFSHSPNKATFYSAILPGLGQIYNGKYWKVPIIYAGIGGLIYYTNYTNYVYKKYKDGYNVKLRIKNGEVGVEDNYERYGEENLKRLKDQWRRWRDLNIVGLGLIYVAQILDADVDAHLFDYDVSEDLTLRIEPVLIPNQVYNYKTESATTLGLRCAIQF
ncbi:MAG: DUF5683 domain-containing protein [Salinivirgaceae bacterium]|nr:DUF5683 domain-containing protein [Salinivirgaceae bacterium]